jgi:hypothetical protein
MPRRPPLIYRNLPVRFGHLQQQHDDTQRQQDGVVVDPTQATGDPSQDYAVFAYGDLSDFGIDGYGAAVWEQTAGTWLQLPGSGGGGGYASLTGPGMTNPTGALTQTGDFTVRHGTEDMLTVTSDGIFLNTYADNRYGLQLVNTGPNGIQINDTGPDGIFMWVSGSAGGFLQLLADSGGDVLIDQQHASGAISISGSAKGVFVGGGPVSIGIDQVGGVLENIGFGAAAPISRAAASGMTTLAQLVDYLHLLGLLT